MRILPSQSSGTKRKVGSSPSLTISSSRPRALGDRLPVAQARPAERVDAEPQARAADRVEVDHRREVVDVGGDVVAPLHRRVLEGHALDAVEARLEQRVGGVLDRAGHVGVGRPAVRRVVLEAAVAGRVVRRRDDDAVGRAAPAAAVVGEDRVRDHRRRRGAVVGVEHDVDAVGAEHLDDRARRGLRQRVRVAAEEQRALDPGAGAVARDGLGDGEHVRLVERARGRRARGARRCRTTRAGSPRTGRGARRGTPRSARRRRSGHQGRAARRRGGRRSSPGTLAATRRRAWRFELAARAAAARCASASTPAAPRSGTA